MTDRADEIEVFLGKTAYRDWKRESLAGDASGRRYMRLSKQDQTVILMDAPPPASNDTKPFTQIAKVLKTNDLCAPDVLAQDLEQGFLLLSDLGEDDFARWLVRNPGDETLLYTLAADVLLKLENVSFPENLKIMTPKVGAEMIAILGGHYMDTSTDDLCGEMEKALLACTPEPNVLALRDFHAENLIWRAGHKGTDRVGILDFQDAFIAPAGYDLASLLRDARRDVPDEITQKILAYFAKKSQIGDDIYASVACLSVQRNLRIIGVFARLAKEMKKPRYLAFMPRVWNHIIRDLEHPSLKQLTEVVIATVPPPTPAYLEGLKG